MYQQCVVAIYDSLDKAKRAVEALEHAPFPADQVSLVTHSIRREVPDGSPLQYGDKTERNALKGAGIGGLVGLLLGAPILAIPATGPVLIAGPLATGITGAIVGGFLGSMSGWGVHPNHIREYQQLIREGAVLVVANGDPREVAEAKRILDETDATEVHLHAAASDETPEVDDSPGHLMEPKSRVS